MKFIRKVCDKSVLKEEYERFGRVVKSCECGLMGENLEMIFHPASLGGRSIKSLTVESFGWHW